MKKPTLPRNKGDGRAIRPAGLALALCSLTVLRCPSVFAHQPSKLDRAMDMLRADLSALPATAERVVGHYASGAPLTYSSNTTYSNFTASTQTCTLVFHVRITVNGHVVRDADESLPLLRVTMFDLTDSQLLIEQSSGLKNVRALPRQFTLRLHSDSGNFNYSFGDAAVAARVWREFATVFQLCTAAG